MQTKVVTGIITTVLLSASVAFGQTTPPAAAKLSFEVSSIKPTTMDQGKIAAAFMSGNMPKLGPHVDGAIADYTYMSIQDLVAEAYKVKPFQVTGPDFMKTDRFDIHAKLPDGSTKEQAREMLQSLLAERFGLVARRETKEHPVMALIVAKGGSKMKVAPADAEKPFDPDSPLEAGEMQMDSPDGPVRMKVDMKTGGGTMNMGKKGTMTFGMDMATQSFKMNANKVTMEGFAEMLTQLMTQMGGEGKTVVDRTDLKGDYQIALEFSMADLMAMAKAAGTLPPEAAAKLGPADGASEPAGSSIFSAVRALGLNLENRRAPIEQIVIDHVEKAPIAN